MLIQLVLFVVGLGLIIWSANHLLKGAVGIAQRYQIPELIIGMVVVALGTSAPEFFVSMFAALHGSTDIAIGNAIGSNIANIGLGLGLVALVAPLGIKQHVLYKKFAALMTAILALWLLSLDWQLDLRDGLILLLVLSALMYWMVRTADAYIDDNEERHQEGWLHIIVGMIVLAAASEMVVWSARGIATDMGVSELLVGLTLTALGTSMPEIVTSLVSAWKKHQDIAVGNILGSNLFNGLGVIGAVTITHQAALSHAMLYRDFVFHAAITLFLLILFVIPKRYLLDRFKGALVLSFFVVYIVILYQQEVAPILE